nr:GNAT family N-acetyltransferase [Leifsonia psychrotolerans]
MANTVVAELDGRVIGFTDIDAGGYIDMMIVLPDATRQGVASALLGYVTASAHAAGIRVLTKHSSLTARAFFETNGSDVVEVRHPLIRGLILTNLAMRKSLPTSPREIGVVVVIAHRKRQQLRSRGNDEGKFSQFRSGYTKRGRILSNPSPLTRAVRGTDYATSERSTYCRMPPLR